MVKKFISVGVIALLMLFGELFTEPVGTEAESFSALDQWETPNSQRGGEYQQIPIDITANGDGHYSLVGNTQINYSGDRVESIHIDDPMVLAFDVSSEYNGGAWVLDLQSGNRVVQELTDVAQALNAQGDTELADDINEALELISQSGPYTSAST